MKLSCWKNKPNKWTVCKSTCQNHVRCKCILLIEKMQRNLVQSRAPWWHFYWHPGSIFYEIAIVYKLQSTISYLRNLWLRVDWPWMNLSTILHFMSENYCTNDITPHSLDLNSVRLVPNLQKWVYKYIT